MICQPPACHAPGVVGIDINTAANPPKASRLVKWKYARTTYKRRNEVERLFRRRKGYRRTFSRFETLNVMYRTFLNFALIVDMIKYEQASATF